MTMTALLDGLAIQIALEDPSVDPGRAFELGMRFASGQLGFEWSRAVARPVGEGGRRCPVDISSWSR